MDDDRIIIDLRKKDEEEEEKDADLIIEIDLCPDGYRVLYLLRVLTADGLVHLPVELPSLDMDRKAMIEKHVQIIKHTKPKTALVRTGRHSTGHVKDILLPPTVIKLIVEGKLDAAALMLRS